MDHVPKWIAAPASDSLLTQDEVAQKNLIARQRYANKTSGNVKPLESSCGSTQVQGVASGKGSEKLRITTIMSQKLENWFNHELDPKGSILPTVSIHYGKEGRLEQLDDSGFDVSCHQQRTHSFFQEWRDLRRQNRLEGLNTEVLVWQQDNAWADQTNHKWLLDLYRRWNGDRPIILVLDAFSAGWTQECKKHAAKLNIILVMVAKGMTMPAQLTDLEFAFPAKATANALKGKMALEKIKAGLWPIKFDRADYHRLVLAQRRKSVEMSDVSNTVVLGSIRTGLLARRPKTLPKTAALLDDDCGKCESYANPDKSAANPESEANPDAPEANPGGTSCTFIRKHFVIVSDEAESFQKQGLRHWSMNKLGHIVRLQDNRGFGSYIDERHTLPVERPQYSDRLEDELEDEYIDPPEHDPICDSRLEELLGKIVTDTGYLGDFLQRHQQGRITLQQLTSVAAKRLRRERCLKNIGHCTCGVGKKGIHSDKCPKSYMTAYNRQVTLETEEKRFKRALATIEDQVKLVVEKRRKLLQDRFISFANNTDAGKLAQALCNSVSTVKMQNDSLVPVPGAKVFGCQVYSVKNESGGTHFTQLDLPLTENREKRTKIFNVLSELGATPLEFFEELKNNQFCIDYTLLALSNKKNQPQALEVALSVAAKCIPDNNSWSTVSLKHLKQLDALPNLRYGTASKVTCDLIAQWKQNRLKRRVPEKTLKAPATLQPLSNEPEAIENNKTRALGSGKLKDKPEKPEDNPGVGLNQAPTLPGLELKSASQALCSRLVGVIVSSFDSFKRTRKLQLLSSTSWLGDEHMDLIICHLRAELHTSVVMVRPCEVEACLADPCHWERVQSCVNQSSHLLFVVSNSTLESNGDHWSILTVPLHEGMPVYWDSIVSSQPHVSPTWKKMRELYTAVKMNVKTRNWPGVECLKFKTVYTQTNCFDCGLYSWLHACKFICGIEKKESPILSETPAALRHLLNLHIKAVNERIPSQK